MRHRAPSPPCLPRRSPADTRPSPKTKQPNPNSYQGLDRVPADLLELLVAGYNPDVADLDLSR